MCCFIVPLVQAGATTALRHHYSIRNSKQNAWSSNLPKLELMLWGGTAMLIVDHILNGELTWSFPFFTALGQEGGAFTMLTEMLTVGLPMSMVITLIYGVMVGQSHRTALSS